MKTLPTPMIVLSQLERNSAPTTKWNGACDDEFRCLKSNEMELKSIARLCSERQQYVHEIKSTIEMSVENSRPNRANAMLES